MFLKYCEQSSQDSNFVIKNQPKCQSQVIHICMKNLHEKSATSYCNISLIYTVMLLTNYFTTNDDKQSKAGYNVWSWKISLEVTVVSSRKSCLGIENISI